MRKNFEQSFHPLFDRESYFLFDLSWRGVKFSTHEQFQRHFSMQIFAGEKFVYSKKISNSILKSALISMLKEIKYRLVFGLRLFKSYHQ